MLLAASVPSSGTPLLAERSEEAEAAPVLVLERRTVAGRKQLPSPCKFDSAALEQLHR